MKNIIIDTASLTVKELNSYLVKNESFRTFFNEDDENDDSIGLLYKSSVLIVIKPVKDKNKIAIFSVLNSDNLKSVSYENVELFAHKMTRYSEIVKVDPIKRDSGDVSLLVTYDLPSKGSFSLEFLEHIITTFNNDADRINSLTNIINEFLKSDI